MKFTDAVRAYWRLWFPQLPGERSARDTSFVVSFVKEHAQGNNSLQAGKFLTRHNHNQMIDKLKSYRFSS